MALVPLTPARFLTTWRLDPWVAAVTTAAAVGYARGVVLAGRRGSTWPAWRIGCFYALGLGGVTVATMSSLAVYGQVLFWATAVQMTLLVSVVPTALALGDPLRLLVAALPEPRARRVERVVGGRVARLLTFPLVTPLLAVGSVSAVLFTGYLPTALEHPAVRELMYAQLLVTGCLFALPMFGSEALPRWCTPGLKVLLAAADGLLDAIPAIVVMTGPGYYSDGGGHVLAGAYYRSLHLGWLPSPRSDQIVGGGLMLTLTELVGLPFAAVLVAGWIRADREEARRVDRYLDQRTDLLIAAPEGPDLGTARIAPPAGPALMRPWWESDPRFAGRYGPAAPLDEAPPERS